MVLSVFASFAMQMTYFYYPSAPVPEEGKVVGVRIKGSIHYITQQQGEYLRWTSHTTIAAGAVFAVLCGVIYLLYGRDAFRRDI